MRLDGHARIDQRADRPRRTVVPLGHGVEQVGGDGRPSIDRAVGGGVVGRCVPDGHDGTRARDLRRREAAVEARERVTIATAPCPASRAAT